MTHTVIDFIAPVKQGKVAALEASLDRLAGETPGSPAGIPFARVPGLHFASLSILGNERAGARLVLECNFDGDLDSYLSALLGKAFAPLHSVFIHCVGCPPEPAALVDYLRAHAVRPAAHHVGNTNRSLAQIRLEADLRREIEAFLDGNPPKGASPGDVRAAILAKLGSRPGGIPPIPTIRGGERVGAWVALAATALVALVLVPFEVLGIALLQLQERRDPVHGGVADPNRVRELARQEDWIVQNHISSAYTVKTYRCVSPGGGHGPP